MNLTETSKLLALATTIDHIDRDLDMVTAWQFVLADVTVDDALTALRAHFADPHHGTEFLKPAHITRQLSAAAPSVPLPPRAGEGMCRIHDGYPIEADGRCASCRRHPEDLRAGAPRPELVPITQATLTVGRSVGQAVS